MRSTGSAYALELVTSWGWIPITIKRRNYEQLDQMLEFWSKICGTTSLIDPYNPGDVIWDWDVYPIEIYQDKKDCIKFWFKLTEHAVLCKLIWGTNDWND